MTRRRLLTTFAALAAVLILVIGVAPIRRALLPWTLNRLLEVTLLTYPPWGFSVVGVEPGNQRILDLGDDGTMPLDFFAAAEPVKGQVLFVHGSIPKGRAFSPYRHLAREIASRGFHVFLPDLNGYGQRHLAPDALPNFGADVARAERAFAKFLDRPDPRGTIVLAHSLGASMALEAVVRHALKPRALVLLDPPFDLPDRLKNPAQLLDRMRRELQVHGGGQLRATDDKLQPYYDGLRPRKLLKALPDPKPPVLFALGARVRTAQAHILASFGTKATWLTILDLETDHYLGMVPLLRSDYWLVTRPHDSELLLKAMADWLDLLAIREHADAAAAKRSAKKP